MCEAMSDVTQSHVLNNRSQGGTRSKMLLLRAGCSLKDVLMQECVATQAIARPWPTVRSSSSAVKPVAPTNSRRWSAHCRGLCGSHCVQTQARMSRYCKWRHAPIWQSALVQAARTTRVRQQSALRRAPLLLRPALRGGGLHPAAAPGQQALARTRDEECPFASPH